MPRRPCSSSHAAARARDAAFKSAVADVEQRLQRTAHVTHVKSPYDAGNAGQISPDGRSALVSFQLAGDFDVTEKRVDAPLAAVAAAQAANPDLRIEQFGDASAGKALGEVFEEDFKKAETLSLPITLLILIVAFGSLVAAGLPLLLALSAVFGTIGLVSLLSQASPVDESITSVILLIGLAVGVDYCLFYLRREREERAAGRSAEAALEAAAATSGRAVLISGFTVMVAMAGMYFTGSQTFSSFATGTIIVVAVAMIGSLTVLPALLCKLGDRVEKGRVPFLGRLRSRNGESRVWGAILDRVLRAAEDVGRRRDGRARRPGGPGVLAEHRRARHRLAAARPRRDADVRPHRGGVPGRPAARRRRDQGRRRHVAVRSRRRSASCAREALASGQVREPIQLDVSPDKQVARLALPIVGDGSDARSEHALTVLRDELIPQTIGRTTGAEAFVTGSDGAEPRLQRPHEGQRADRVRVRADDGVPAAARDVPLDRDPDQGDRAEPAVRRCRLRRARLRVPAGTRRGAARLRVDRGDHVVAAAVPVRDPVRALDGLPRVHPQPDPRGVRPRHEHRGRGRARHQVDGRRRDERRDRDGRGVLDLRDADARSSSSRWASASRRRS